MSSFRKIAEENFITLKINTGNPEAYLEHCQAPVESALQMKNLREKVLINHEALQEGWMLATFCKALVLFLCL